MTRPPRRQPPNPGPDPEVLADRLHSAAIHLLRRLRLEDDASGLTAPQLSALSVVVFGGPIALGDLARAEQVSAPTMSRLVTDLEREGLVSREADADDARVRRIRATALGRKKLEDGRARRVQRLAERLRALSSADYAELARAAGTLSDLARPSPGE